MDDVATTIEKAEPILDRNNLAPLIKMDDGYITNGVRWSFTRKGADDHCINILALPILSSVTLKFIKELIAKCSKRPVDILTFLVEPGESYSVPTDPLKL